MYITVLLITNFIHYNLFNEPEFKMCYLILSFKKLQLSHYLREFTLTWSKMYKILYNELFTKCIKSKFLKLNASFHLRAVSWSQLLA